MAVADHTGQSWLQGFNDVGQVVFGMTADQLEEIKVSLPSDQPTAPGIGNRILTLTRISAASGSGQREVQQGPAERHRRTVQL